MILIHGDLLQLGKNNEFDIIMHGCNCFNTMGGGIARQVRDQFHDAYLADQDTLAGDRNKLGRYSIGMSGRLVIINAYTQYHMASRIGDDVFEYRAFDTVLNSISERFGKYKIGMPMIGMGLAGGDPARILPMIENFAQRVEQQGGTVSLVEYKQSQ